MTVLLSSFLMDFCESFHTAHHPTNSGLESAKELPLFIMSPNVMFSSEDIDFSFLAVLSHPLSIAVENTAVSIIGMKLLYCLHWSRSSAYTVHLQYMAYC
jgi:hypothetical protein